MTEEELDDVAKQLEIAVNKFNELILSQPSAEVLEAKLEDIRTVVNREWMKLLFRDGRGEPTNDVHEHTIRMIQSPKGGWISFCPTCSYGGTVVDIYARSMRVSIREAIEAIIARERRKDVPGSM